ncbi:uncharacterized protein LOC132740284 [Ruditapes philippinarum]|uniref:uncharacterized protein LOC132740284 n=1 Tax=Ruditapes philippinarum TaxID=129788 RepID=UPI00295B4474|nr:uncharacterized protein LOC132740284 [Ruditapes philippinarum]
MTDIYLCGVYMWFDDSPIASIENVDLFEMLTNDVFYFEDLGKVLLVGDWNGRVGNKSDFIVCDNNVKYIDSDDYFPDAPLCRASSDPIVNTRGEKILDFCKTTCMRLANGRLGKDCNVGAFTYYSRQSNSTIDYLLLKECNFQIISEFEICQFNEFSDHAPLSFTVKYLDTKSNPRNLESQSTYFKWRDADKDKFRRGLLGRMTDLNDIFESSSSSDIENIVLKFSKIIQDVAEPLFKRKGRKKGGNSDCSWFDEECYEKKHNYLNALSIFNNYKNETNRHILCDLKKEFKNIVRKKKRQYRLKRAQELSELKTSKPREFWKHFKKRNVSQSSDIPILDFQNYFANMFEEIRATTNFDANISNDNIDPNISNPTFEELNIPISCEEVRDAVKRLNRNKASCPSDDLLNEYFIFSIDILVGHITDLFNRVFDAGYFPEIWSEGFIIPLHKKGDHTNVNNYRGITLLSNFGKLFISILTNRVEKWFDENNILSDAQFGFRKG